MVSWINKRRQKKSAKQALSQAKHLMNYNEDRLATESREAIRQAMQEVEEALKASVFNEARLSGSIEKLECILFQNIGNKRCTRSAFAENLEMIIVAVAAAMALRTYALQPFKIPTGSMQPTLYGITAETTNPDWTDRQPFKLVKFFFTGTWYREIYAPSSGLLGEGADHPRDPSVRVYRLGTQLVKIPKDIILNENNEIRPAFHPQRRIQKGEKLWAGYTHRGDHLFVNKVIWNFRKPKRDEVMVFRTENIFSLEPGTHYIKRMCGMPNDQIAIHPPNLVVNGQIVSGFEGIDRVSSATNGYAGYVPAGKLGSPNLVWRLKDHEYFALGDNTMNSRDSRYWGPVPESNLVGPAFFVYWPFSSRWGLIK